MDGIDLDRQTGLTGAQRTLRARAGAYAQASQGKTNTGPGTRAFLAKFSALVDPEGELDPKERDRRASFAVKSHMAKLALASSIARSKTPRA